MSRRKRKQPYAPASVRLPQWRVQQMVVAAASTEKELRELSRAGALALRQQSTVHAREVVELSLLLDRQRQGLEAAVQLVNAARRNEWTPACDQELAQIRETIRG